VLTGKLTQQQGDMLAEAYRYYRQRANHYVLQEQPALMPKSQMADYPTKVTEIWQRWLGDNPSNFTQ
jgi:glutamate-ammonia-ligase adenylyltransferase